MHKLFSGFLLISMILVGCLQDKTTYWISIYPDFFAGGALTIINDSICTQYLPDPVGIDCMPKTNNDSIYDTDGEFIGLIQKERITVFDEETRIYYNQFAPCKLDVSYDSIFNLITNNPWQLKQGRFIYQIDFTRIPTRKYSKKYIALRHIKNTNDTIIPNSLFKCEWFVSSFANSLILGLSYSESKNCQLFKILSAENNVIVLEAQNEYNDNFSEIDTTKKFGETYKMTLIPK